MARRVGERELSPRCRGHPNNPHLLLSMGVRAGVSAIRLGPSVCVRFEGNRGGALKKGDSVEGLGFECGGVWALGANGA